MPNKIFSSPGPWIAVIIVIIMGVYLAYYIYVKTAEDTRKYMQEQKLIK